MHPIQAPSRHGRCSPLRAAVTVVIALVGLSGCGLVLQATPPPVTTVPNRGPVVAARPQSGDASRPPSTAEVAGATTSTTSPDANVQSPTLAASMLSQIQSRAADERSTDPCAAASRAALAAVKVFDPAQTPANAFHTEAVRFAALFELAVRTSPGEGYDRAGLEAAAATLRQQAETAADANTLQIAFQAMLQAHVAGFDTMFASVAKVCPDLPPIMTTPVQDLIDSMKPQ